MFCALYNVNDVRVLLIDWDQQIPTKVPDFKV